MRGLRRQVAPALAPRVLSSLTAGLALADRTDGDGALQPRQDSPTEPREETSMKHSFKALLVLAPLAFLAACGGGDDSLDDRLDIADPKVRLVHAATLSPAVTLYRNDVAQADATNISYTGASKYFDVSTGSAAWRVGTAS